MMSTNPHEAIADSAAQHMQDDGMAPIQWKRTYNIPDTSEEHTGFRFGFSLRLSRPYAGSLWNVRVGIGPCIGLHFTLNSNLTLEQAAAMMFDEAKRLVAIMAGRLEAV